METMHKVWENIAKKSQSNEPMKTEIVNQMKSSVDNILELHNIIAVEQINEKTFSVTRKKSKHYVSFIEEKLDFGDLYETKTRIYIELWYIQMLLDTWSKVWNVWIVFVSWENENIELQEVMYDNIRDKMFTKPASDISKTAYKIIKETFLD